MAQSGPSKRQRAGAPVILRAGSSLSLSHAVSISSRFGRDELGGGGGYRRGNISLVEKLLTGADRICEGLGAVLVSGGF